eukprot:g43771.t1
MRQLMLLLAFLVQGVFSQDSPLTPSISNSSSTSITPTPSPTNRSTNSSTQAPSHSPTQPVVIPPLTEAPTRSPTGPSLATSSSSPSNRSPTPSRTKSPRDSLDDLDDENEDLSDLFPPEDDRNPNEDEDDEENLFPPPDDDNDDPFFPGPGPGPLPPPSKKHGTLFKVLVSIASVIALLAGLYYCCIYEPNMSINDNPLSLGYGISMSSRFRRGFTPVPQDDLRWDD